MNSPFDKMQEKIADYVLGILSQKEIDTLTEHINNCTACSQYLQELKNENRLLLQLGEKLDTDMTIRQDKVLEALRHHSPTARIKVLSIWRIIMKSKITKLAAAAVIIISLLFGLEFIGRPDMATVAWGKVVENVEQIESFIFQHQISITSVPDGTAIQEAETTTYVSSEFGLRQDAYMNGQVIGISYIPPAGTIITQVMPAMKKYRRVSTPEEHIRKTHDQANPKGMIKEFMSFEHTQLGREIIDGVEVEGIEVNDPGFLTILTSVFESAVGRLWVDVETNLPVRTEIVGVSGDGSIETKIVAYDFDWDAEPEPGVFEPNIPADYTLYEK